MTGKILVHWILALVEVFNETPYTDEPVFYVRPLQQNVLQREAVDRIHELRNFRKDYWKQKPSDYLSSRQKMAWDMNEGKASCLSGIGASSLLPAVFAQLSGSKDRIESEMNQLETQNSKKWNSLFGEKSQRDFAKLKKL